MFRRRLSLLVALLLALGPLAEMTQAIIIVKEGKAAASIVIREAALKTEPYKPARGEVGGPDAKIKLAALDLEAYLEKISGAKLPIIGDTQQSPGAVILVGPSERTVQLGLKVP